MVGGRVGGLVGVVMVRVGGEYLVGGGWLVMD